MNRKVVISRFVLSKLIFSKQYIKARNQDKLFLNNRKTLEKTKEPI